MKIALANESQRTATTVVISAMKTIESLSKHETDGCESERDGEREKKLNKSKPIKIHQRN